MTTTTQEHQCDVLVIGSGAAGLSLALRLASTHQVIVLSKGPLSEGATLYAQGGIAAVFDEQDSVESHVEDTQIAGGGICDTDVVDFIARNAKDCVQWLIDGGVPFDQEDSDDEIPRYHLTREEGTVTDVFFTPPMRQVWRCKTHCKTTFASTPTSPYSNVTTHWTLLRVKRSASVVLIMC